MKTKFTVYASQEVGGRVIPRAPRVARSWMRSAFVPAGWTASRAFTLIEIMVVIVLLSLIILGLMAMFDQTQKAFRAGMAQTDQLEGGRMFTDQLTRDVEQIQPSYLTNTLNFLAVIPGPTVYTPATQTLPGTPVPRTNLLQDLFFLTRNNQTWSGVGYFVRTNAGIGTFVDPVGTLYRYQTNMPVGVFHAFPQAAYQTFLNATNSYGVANPSAAGSLSKILDGVVEFHIHCYDTNGVLLNGYSSINYPSNFVYIQNWPNSSNDMSVYAFSNNIVPAYVEVELGILEPAVLKRYNSIPNQVARTNFLASHAGNVQVFRQRIPVRNVDPLAYQP
jgi:prepilin-type N-terminal cleavage/methylation domain-containing protein